MNIEIKRGYQNFCIWYVYVDGEPVGYGEGYLTHLEAEKAAQLIEDELGS